MTEIKKGDLVNSGKAKSLFKTSDPDLYILHYRDDTSAFDGEKKESLEDKGETNNKFNAFVFDITSSFYLVFTFNPFLCSPFCHSTTLSCSSSRILL